MTTLETLVGDLRFPEGLRWHQGELWFSDFGTRRVFSVDPHGAIKERAYIAGQPSGIGFLPDGTPLVVSMLDHLLIRIEGEELKVVADLSDGCVGPANDMIVDAKGRVYFGSFGFEPRYEGATAFKESDVLRFTDGGGTEAVARQMAVPNGMAISADGRTMIVAETFGNRLTAFDIGEDGGLSGRRVFADLGERSPDGICLDAENAVWVGCPFAHEFVRVAEGGEILDLVETPGSWAITCALGGDDGRTLFCATSETTLEEFHDGHYHGAIEVARVRVPGI